MKALIFAAGFGTRLRPITDTLPKALVEVAGVTMLERIIRKLSSAGAGPIVVNACHFAEKITGFVESRDFGVEVEVSVENAPLPLETGGGIKHARPLLEGGGAFLVHNVDILSNADLRSFADASGIVCSGSPQDDASAGEERPLAALLLEDRRSDRMLLFDGDMHLVGWTDTRTGEVRGPYPELNPDNCRQYSFCGIHLVSDDVFPLMESFPDSFGIIDFYLSVCSRRVIRGIVGRDLKMIDIGTPEHLAQASRALATAGDGGGACG